MPRASRSCRHSGWVNKLWFALKSEDSRAVSALIRHGANVNHVFKDSSHNGMSPINLAISRNSKEVVCLLITAGCNLEQQDPQGETPIFHALRRDKLAIAKLLVEANCDINHCSRHGETPLFLAIRWGRKDFTDYLLSIGANTDIINSQDNTPLLHALELYENAHTTGHVTRRSAPSNLRDIIISLVPCCSCINHPHPNKGTALRITLNVEALHSPHDLRLTRLLMQHGAVPDRLFFLRYGGLLASNTRPGSSEFFTLPFFSLAIAAGAPLQRERAWLQTVLTEMPEELQPHQQLFIELLSHCVMPLPLHLLCVRAVRAALRGRVWQKIEQLPLPASIKQCLKLCNY